MTKLHKTLAAAGVALALAAAGSAQAVVYFQVEANPGGAKMFNTSAKDSLTSTGTVVSPNDIGITVTGLSDFANGFSTITPIKGGSLTDLVFTPVNPLEFSDFSFRGQDILANQTIAVVVTDQNGNVQTIDFNLTTGANADFARIGIIGLAGETIKSVEIQNSGGFEESKQFEFSGAGIANFVPEPATWAMMLMGFFGLGAVLRSRRTRPALAA